MSGEVQASPLPSSAVRPAVALRGITKRFPAVLANDRVDFEAAEGEVHALLGENGAGKTTLSNILTGLYRPDEGEIVLFGEPVAFHSPRDALDAGIAMVHQHFRLVSPFTVAENVVLGDHRDVGRAFLLRPRAIESRVVELSRRYGIAVDARARIWQLSVGEQQRVEILKALYQDARILILDEPTAVLTPQEANGLFETIRAMAADGRTVIFISHKLHEVKAVADRVTVLRRGRSLATVPASEATPRSLAALMVGREVEINGRPVRSGDPRSAISARVAYVPEDRLGTGVAPGLSIASNVVLKSYRRSPVSSGPFLRFARIRDLADRAIDKYDVRTSGCQVPAWQLSGGNVQKVVLAREFSGEPDVLVAASPTRGLDVSSIETVHSYLREAASAGVGVSLISEDLDEILALADRIAVMYEGGVAGERDGESATV